MCMLQMQTDYSTVAESLFHTQYAAVSAHSVEYSSPDSPHAPRQLTRVALIIYEISTSVVSINVWTL